MTNIKIKEIAIFHPENKINNDFYIEHFDKQGKDIRRLLKHVGRENRYIVDSKFAKESGITMAVKASIKALDQANLSGEDIDMIIYSTQIPEQTIPMSSIFIHQGIKGKNRTLLYDLNATCAGMSVAVEQASRNMLTNPRIERALVVGSDYFSLILDPESETTYPLFADVAVAVILEKTNEDIGFIDAIHYSDHSSPTSMLFPAHGLTHLLKTSEGKYMATEPFDDAEMFPRVYESINELLDKYDLKPSDVKCCFSQSNKNNVKLIQENIGFTDDQIIFVADQFGYSGTSSPFLALHEGTKAGKIKRGDYVLFWTIGIGYEFITMLFKY